MLCICILCLSFLYRFFLKLKVFSLFSECTPACTCMYVCAHIHTHIHAWHNMWKFSPSNMYLLGIELRLSVRSDIEFRYLWPTSLAFFFSIKIDLTQFCMCGCMCHTMSVKGRKEQVWGGFPTMWVSNSGHQVWQETCLCSVIPLFDSKKDAPPVGDRQGYSPLY